MTQSTFFGPVCVDLRGFLVVMLKAGLQGPSPALFWALTDIR